MNEWRRQELAEQDYMGPLLEGILGSTSEERRIQLPPKYLHELRQIKKLRQAYNLDLVRRPGSKHQFLLKPLSKEEFQNLTYSVFDKTTPYLPILVDRLSLLTSKYPSFSGIVLEVRGFHRIKGKFAKSLLALLVFLNYSIRSEEDSFLRFLFAEKIIKAAQRYQGESNKGWDNVRLLTEFFSRKEICDEYLQLKYQNKSALWDLYSKGSKVARAIEFSFFTGTSQIIERIRRKGYNDKGSRKPDHLKGRDEYSIIYLKEKFGNQLVEEETIFREEDGLLIKKGGLVLNDYNSTKNDVVQQLTEIWKKANKSFLEFQQQESEKKLKSNSTSPKKPSTNIEQKHQTKGEIENDRTEKD